MAGGEVYPDVIQTKEIIIAGKDDSTSGREPLKIVNLNGTTVLNVNTDSLGYGVLRIKNSLGTTTVVAYGDGQVAIGDATVSSVAALNVVSTTRALIPPRMTTAQGATLSNSGVTAGTLSGAIIYDNTLKKLKVFTGGAWETITSTAGA